MPQNVVAKSLGKFMTVWKKQSDGSWKIAVDMFNANGG